MGLSLAAMSAGRLARAADMQRVKTRPVQAHAAPESWGMMLDLTVRIPPGAQSQWDSFWGDKNVPLLEEKGQWLWAAWRPLTGQQDTVTHQWAYRDLEHFQAMAQMRATDPSVHELARSGVPIYETLSACVTTPLSYHPRVTRTGEARKPGVLVTSRVIHQNGVDLARYNALVADYLLQAATHGGELVGAFQSFFGWTPAYRQHIWWYPNVETYGQARRARESDPRCRQLAVEMRRLLPLETLQMHEPLRYSRLQ